MFFGFFGVVFLVFVGIGFVVLGKFYFGRSLEF